MADLQKTVEIIFGAVDHTGSTISGISSNINSFADGVSTVTGPLSDFADLALESEAAIIALGVAMLGLAVNESAQLNAAVNEIGTLFNATPDQVATMKASIKDYATTSVFSFEDITKSTYDMVSATGDAEGAVSALEVAERAAVVGASDLGTSVDALTTVVNAYGLGLEASTDVMGAFIIAVQNGKTTLPELSESIGRVASTAAAANVPFDDLLAAVAALTAGGVKTAESMTYLQALLKGLVDPTDEMKEALGGMSLQTNTLQEIMQRLNTVTGGSFEKMNELFGRLEATKGAIILATDASGTFSRSLESMGNKATVVAENFALMEDNLKLVVQNMQNNLRNTLESIGAELLPEWTNIVKAISDIFKGVDVGLDSKNFEQVFTSLNDFQAAVDEYLRGIAAALPEAMAGLDFTGLLDAFGGLSDTIGSIFDGLDLTDAEDLQKAMQFIIDSVETLTRVVTGIAEAWKPTIQQIKLFVDEVNGAGADSQQLAGFIAGLGQQFETFKGLITGSAEALDKAGSALSVIATSSVANTLTNMAGGAGALASALGSAGLTGAALTAAGAVGYTIGSGLAWGIDQLLSAMTGSETSLGSWIYDITHSGEAAEVSAEQMYDFANAVANIPENKNVTVDVDVPSGEVRDYTAEVNELDEETIQLEGGTQRLNEQMKAMGFVYKEVKDAAGNITGEWVKQGDAAKTAADGAIQYRVEIDELGNRTLVATDAMQKVTKAITDTGKSADDSAKKVNELEKTMLELASNERIAAMEFSANIRVAEIEAQAEQVKAAFDSIASTIESTGQTAADLFSLLSNSDSLSFTQMWAIEDAIEQQLEIQQKSFELQKKLTEAQIRMIDAQTNALSRGDASIKIESAGLEPEIEAFMWKILERIRLRVAADQQNFLMGIG